MKQKLAFTGIVLKNLDYQDNAKIVYILTEQEIISVLIRGAKKIESKTRPLAQIMTKISGLRTDSNTFSTLTEGIIENNYNGIKEDFVKTSAMMCVLEKVYYLFPNISDPKKLYNFLLDIFEQMENTHYPKSLLLLFEIKLWYLLGINPNFSSCVECGTLLDEGVLLVSGGGFLCYSCQDKYLADLSLVDSKIVKLLYHIRMEKVDEHFLELITPFFLEISHTVDTYYEKYLDFKNKSKEVFYKVI